ncbi:MAG: hypothetical protein K2J60_13470 [Acetatifactor sp.]|nr:hypothetical protein [Acetatifactor sp.]
MSVDVSKLVITEVAQITAFNNAGELEFIMDEVQNGTINNTQEKSDVTGRNGRKIASLKKNKAVTVSATNGVLVGGALAAQTGTEVEQGTFNVRITDVMTVHGNTCKTSRTAVGVTGAEIGTLYVKNANGSLGAKLEQDAAAAEGKFKYDPATREITVDGIADGTELVAFYDAEVEAAKISNDSEKYSKVLKLYIDVVLQDSCDVEYAGQVIIQRADVSGEFELSLGGDSFAHSFEAESLAGGCSGSTNLWDLVVYGVN